LLEAIIKAEIIAKPVKLSYVKYMIAKAGKSCKKAASPVIRKAPEDPAEVPAAPTLPSILNLGQGFGLQLPVGMLLGDLRYLSLKFNAQGDGICDIESVLSYEHIPITDPK
jgi:hypothetical protein